MSVQLDCNFVSLTWLNSGHSIREATVISLFIILTELMRSRHLRMPKMGLQSCFSFMVVIQVKSQTSHGTHVKIGLLPV